MGQYQYIGVVECHPLAIRGETEEPAFFRSKEAGRASAFSIHVLQVILVGHKIERVTGQSEVKGNDLAGWLPIPMYQPKVLERHFLH